MTTTAAASVKHFLTIVRPSDDPRTAVEEEHETEDAARAFCTAALSDNPQAEVLVYRFVTRAKAKLVTEFDGGCV